MLGKYPNLVPNSPISPPQSDQPCKSTTSRRISRGTGYLSRTTNCGDRDDLQTRPAVKMCCSVLSCRMDLCRETRATAEKDSLYHSRRRSQLDQVFGPGMRMRMPRGELSLAGRVVDVWRVGMLCVEDELECGEVLGNVACTGCSTRRRSWKGREWCSSCALDWRLLM